MLKNTYNIHSCEHTEYIENVGCCKNLCSVAIPYCFPIWHLRFSLCWKLMRKPQSHIPNTHQVKSA